MKQGSGGRGQGSGVGGQESGDRGQKGGLAGLKRGALTCLLVVGATIGIAETACTEPPAGAAGMLFAEIPGSELGMLLPLKHTTADLLVLPGILDARVTQEFVNDTPFTLEATYSFPLPSGATLSDMAIHLDSRTIRSVVQEKRQARQTYETARREGRKAAIVEEERPNIFTMAVANMLPGETVRIELAYMERLSYEEGAYPIVFPTVVAPRYMPEQALSSTAAGDSQAIDTGPPTPPVMLPGVDPEHRFSLSVRVKGMSIARATSTTHAFTSLATGATPGIEVGGPLLTIESALPDADVEIRLHPLRDEEPLPSLLVTEGATEDVVMLNLLPPLEGLVPASPESRDVLFLIDTSGSMSGDAMLQAKAGLMRCLDRLRPQDHFLVMRFSDQFSADSEGPREATPQAIAASRRFVDALEADGGTEMQPALSALLGKPTRPGALPIIIFLTDGDVGNESELELLLTRELKRGRLFTFGIGSAPNEFLMRRMADVGRGQARFIRSDEDIDRVMGDFFSTLDAPVLTDITVQWIQAAGVELQPLAVVPSRCPDLFAGRPLQVMAALPPGALEGVQVIGTLGTEEVAFYQPITVSDPLVLSVLPRLLAGGRVSDLMAERLRADGANDKALIKEEILSIALEHQLVTAFTSRVAVEEQIVRDPTGKRVSVNVPARLPRGWDPNGLVPTATQDPLRLLMAGALSALLVVWRIRSRRAVA